MKNSINTIAMILLIPFGGVSVVYLLQVFGLVPHTTEDPTIEVYGPVEPRPVMLMVWIITFVLYLIYKHVHSKD